MASPPERVTAPPWVPPEEFDGYRLLRALGRGRMGHVYLAQDTFLERLVAVKLVSTSSPDPHERERFLVEARAIARLQHPNVVAIYRVGEVQGRPYLVYEFVRGETLDHAVKPMAWAVALRIGVDLARGLAAAHRRGVVHRDIKPANAILSDDRVAKLLDFGLAKLADALPPPPPLDVPPRAPGEAPLAFASTDSLDLARARTLPPLSDDLDGSATQSLRLDPEPAPAPVGTPEESEPLYQTSPGTVLGTPLYMPPEAWRGEPATYAGDVYSLGALLYTLCTGSPPHHSRNLVELRRRVLETDSRPLAEQAPVDPSFAAVVDRCLARKIGDRYPTGDALRDALERLVAGSRQSALPEGNPYRGLSAFEAEHRAIFFGRDADIRTVLDRLRTEPFVLVAGDSGVGKSSLCRAGVLPEVMSGGLGEDRRWTHLDLLPGRRPLTALLAALAGRLGVDEEELGLHLALEPSSIGREIRRRLGERAGLLVFVDQLEELLTFSDPEEARHVAELLGSLAAGTPGVRLLATVRGDYLTRLASLTGLGDAVTRALYLCRPLSQEAIREAVVGPARAKGVTFESEALVESLVESTSRAEGGLPLLQFALAALWDARDQRRQVIPFSALEATGGVAGALARHADDVVERLLPAQRAAARRILLSLVTVHGTRARRTEEELVRGDASAAAALEALVRGRLLVARESDGSAAYEVAHETLLQGWPTLRRWLEEDAGSREVGERLAAAVSEWERLGRASEALWSRRQLAEVALLLPDHLGERERTFLSAAQRRERRRRIRDWALILGLPLLAGLLYGLVAMQERRVVEEKIDRHLEEARRALSGATNRERALEELRRLAFALFDRRDPAAEPTWTKALQAARLIDRLRARAGQALEAALVLDASRHDVRATFADVLFERALAAERDKKLERRDDLLERLELYDESGARRARWSAPARLTVRARPAAQIELWRYEKDEAQRRLVEKRTLPPDEAQLPPGSYVLTLSAPGRAPVRYPFVLSRAEVRAIEVDLPRVEDVPKGFVYVPPGSFLFGTAADESVRAGFFATVPVHEMRTGAYLISERETTYGEWLEYLHVLDPAERDKRTPRASPGFRGAVELARGPGGWWLTLQPTTRAYTAPLGQPIVYAERRRRRNQDWRRFPVSGISFEDAEAYTTWLDRSGRVPGARLCTEAEWERGARGADDRELPHGDALEADDANFDETYGRVPVSFGPDEVGSHPASRSPFGLDDMAGNVWEWARATVALGERVARGGSFYHDQNTARSTNRQVTEPTFRDQTVGLRVCATPR